ncbi:TlpA disulfide reductase family protein [Pedobacter nyackensis]|uniref:TlpA family protein disulfide reductase n=1 Tax=Pedobacter nyackensis TaxID=475255 RepID=UPI00292CF118|nr:TlpA disulfide reductase family protein [Pedobacter nyackensis]
MKLKFLFLTIIALTTSSKLFAQNPVQITASFSSSRKTAVKLFKVINGRTTEIANAIPAINGRFGFLFYPEYDGIYVIGTGNDLNPNQNNLFYFKGGDQLDFTISDTSYVLNGKLNSKENIVLKQWQDLTNPLYQKAINFMGKNSTFKDYFPLQEEIVAKSKKFLAGKATGNAKFDKQIKDIMEMDLTNFATNFLNTPRSAHPSVKEYSEFYNTLKASKIAQTTGKVYNYPYGQKVLLSLVSVNMRQEGKAYKPGLEGIETFASYVPNDTLKGDITLDFISRYKTYNEYKEAMNLYGKYILTKAQKDKSEALLLPLLTYKTGTDAFQFSYPDKDGKTISLASLKNKVVLVDVWATWCGPCKAEIPFLKQLEKDVEGQPIQIISLSTDNPKDKEKWLKMIKDENLGGLQLFANGPGNEFSKYYKINAIPRFLVFDKNGKIVTVDSPRPSNPKLKELLLAEAAK